VDDESHLLGLAVRADTDYNTMGGRDFDAYLQLDSRFNGTMLHQSLVGAGLNVVVEENLPYDAATRMDFCFILGREQDLESVISNAEDDENSVLERFVRTILYCKSNGKKLVALLVCGLESNDSTAFEIVQRVLGRDCQTMRTIDESNMAKLIVGIVAEEVGNANSYAKDPPSAVPEMCKQLVGLKPKAVLELAEEQSLADLSSMTAEQLLELKALGRISSKKLFDFFGSTL